MALGGEAVEIDIDAAQRGILFIDELDKIATGGSRQGPDVSREGVQRDLLPIVEVKTPICSCGFRKIIC